MAFKRLDTLLTSRFLLRVVALGIALLVWFYVAGDQGIEVGKSLRVKVDYRNASPGFSVSHSASDALVRVSASRRLFEGLELGQLACVVDLKGLESGKYRLPLRVLLPPGVRLVAVVPDIVTVELVRLIEKVLPVRVAWKGEFPEGTLLDKLVLTPSEVTVRGPENVLQDIVEAVASVSPGQVLEGGEVAAEIRLKTAKGLGLPSGVDFYPKETRLQASMVEDVTRKILPVVVSLSGAPEFGYRIEETVVIPPTVELLGAKSVLDPLENLEISPIDVSGLAEDKTFEVEPVLPLGQVRPVGSGKVRVSLVVRPVNNGTGVLRLKLPVKVEGKSVYPSWKPVPSTVSVQLAPEAGAEGLPNLEDIPVEVFVDVTNLVSKKISVPVQIRVNSKEIRILKVEPERVTLHAMNP